jgi:hypothetical protein
MAQTRKKNNNNKDGISKLPAKLEIKWRRRRSSRFQLLDGRVNGILEEWIKWAGVLVQMNQTTTRLISSLTCQEDLELL